MSRYIKILEINLYHSYYSDGKCRDIIIEHSETTISLMKRMRVVSRLETSSISYFCEEDNKVLLIDFINDDTEETNFCFKIKSTDIYFQNFTEVFPVNDNALLYFTNEDVISEDGGFLSTEKLVSKADQLPIKDDRFKGIISKKDTLIKPIGVVHINLKRLKPLLEDIHSDTKHLAYKLHFNTRSTVWNYYLTQRKLDFEQDVMIKDSDEKVTFSDSQNTALLDGSPSKLIRSEESLPFKEYPPFNFQLISRKKEVNKIEIKNLPTASINYIENNSQSDNCKYKTNIFIYY